MLQKIISSLLSSVLIIAGFISFWVYVRMHDAQQFPAGPEWLALGVIFMAVGFLIQFKKGFRESLKKFQLSSFMNANTNTAAANKNTMSDEDLRKEYEKRFNSNTILRERVNYNKEDVIPNDDDSKPVRII